MKYILVIWFTTFAGGAQPGTVSEFESLKDCEAVKTIVTTDMEKGLKSGRWGSQIKGFNARCFELGPTIET